jgi:hypothetical protein
MALADAAYTEVHPWDVAMRGHSHLQDDIQEIESRSRAVLVYEPTLVPGLLQTAEFARRVFTLFEPAYPEHVIPGVTAGRVERQAALFDPARQFGFLDTEAALRLRPGPHPWSAYDRILGSSERTMPVMPAPAPGTPAPPRPWRPMPPKRSKSVISALGRPR